MNLDDEESEEEEQMSEEPEGEAGGQPSVRHAILHHLITCIRTQHRPPPAAVPGQRASGRGCMSPLSPEEPLQGLSDPIKGSG